MSATKCLLMPFNFSMYPSKIQYTKSHTKYLMWTVVTWDQPAIRPTLATWWGSLGDVKRSIKTGHTITHNKDGHALPPYPESLFPYQALPVLQCIFYLCREVKAREKDSLGTRLGHTISTDTHKHLSPCLFCYKAARGTHCTHIISISDTLFLICFTSTDQ